MLALAKLWVWGAAEAGEWGRLATLTNGPWLSCPANKPTNAPVQGLGPPEASSHQGRDTSHPPKHPGLCFREGEGQASSLTCSSCWPEAAAQDTSPPAIRNITERASTAPLGWADEQKLLKSGTPGCHGLPFRESQRGCSRSPTRLSC